MNLNEFKDRLEGVERSGDGWVARCPAHGDAHPSLSVCERDGKILLHCHVGCTAEQVVQAMGLKLSDLFTQPKAKPAARKRDMGKLVCDYLYHDGDGNVVYKASRYQREDGTKTFTISHPDSTAPYGWRFGLTDVNIDRVCYHLPEVVKAAAGGHTIVICEGEKDVDNVRRLGYCATCNVGGAGKWGYQFPDSWGEWFRGAGGILIVADNDPATKQKKTWNAHKRTHEMSEVEHLVGQKHAWSVKRQLEEQGVTCPIKLMTMPAVDGVQPKDFTDWMDAVKAQGKDVKAEFEHAVKYAAEWPEEWRFDGAARALEQADDVSDSCETGRFGRWIPRSPGDPDRSYEVDFEHLDQVYHFVFLEGETVGAMVRQAWKTIWESQPKGADEKQKTPSVPGWRVLAWCASVWLLMRGSFFWDLDSRTFDRAMYFDRSPASCRLMRIFDDEFFTFVARAAELDDVDPKKGDLGKIMGIVKQIALSDDYSTGVVPSNLWDRRGDACYISSGDADMYRLRDGMVERVQNGTDGVLFLRGKTLSPWKLVDGPGINPFENALIFSGASWDDPRNGPITACSWVLYLFACHAAKPPLLLTGPAGSGKTRMAKAIKEMLCVRTSGRVDLSVQQMEKGDKGQDAFWAAVNDGRFEVFDNLDQKIDWAADALQIAATDGQTKRRTLYTTYGVSILKANAYLVFTSNNPIVSTEGNGGMADRLVTIRLLRNPRKSLDKELSADIAEHRDEYLTWVARTVAKAIADRVPVENTINSRHPDFGEFAIRCGRAIGREQEFVDALGAVEIDKLLLPVQNDSIGREILRVLAAYKWEWTFTATDMASSILAAMGDEKDERSSSFINSRRVAATIKKLNRQLTTLLRMEGPKVVHGYSTYFVNGKRLGFDDSQVGWVGCLGDFGETPVSADTSARAYGFTRNGVNIPPIPPTGGSRGAGAGALSPAPSTFHDKEEEGSVSGDDGDWEGGDDGLDL